MRKVRKKGMKWNGIDDGKGDVRVCGMKLFLFF